MQITIIESSPQPETLIAEAAHQCYGGEPRVGYLTPEKCERLIARLLKDGHTSPFEHASITFLIVGISRACSHQLVRHRLASYSQQSQRYVSLDKEPEWVIPPSVETNETFKYLLHEAWGAYRLYVELGYPVEDARYLLPNATPTNIVTTMNFRELLNFFELRCCRRAQWEIREVADTMRELAREIAPHVFANAGARCDTCASPCDHE